MSTLLDKCAYFEDSNVQQEHSYTELQGFIPGIDGDRTMDQDRRENHEPDGFDNKEFEQFSKKRKKKMDRLRKMHLLHKKLQEMKNEDNGVKQDKHNDVFQPTPFYSSLYGGTGLEGSFDYNLEYYSGSVINEPGAITNNPYNTIYQQATERSVRRILRASFFQRHISA